MQNKMLPSPSDIKSSYLIITTTNGQNISTNRPANVPHNILEGVQDPKYKRVGNYLNLKTCTVFCLNNICLMIKGEVGWDPSTS